MAIQINVYSFLIFNYLFQSLNDSYVADVYDEILTQAEIQGHINSVNGEGHYCIIKF